MSSGSESKSLVFDGKYLQALVRRGSSPFVLVTFNARGFRANGRAIWAEPVIRKFDLNAVGFVTRRPNWFPAEDLVPAMAADQPFLDGFEERIGYGYSQGGYAAIRASRPLALTATIALSPQWSIDPTDIIDTRYNKFFDAQANGGMAIAEYDTPARLLLLVDPYHQIDVAHLRRIQEAVGPSEIVSLPSVQHDSVGVVAGSVQFEKMLDAVRGGLPLGAALSSFRRNYAHRRENVIGRLLLRGQGRRAAALLDGPEFSGRERTKQLIRFVRHGMAEHVIRAARRNAREQPEDPLALATFAVALQASGKPGRAATLAARAEAAGGGRRVKDLLAAASKVKAVNENA
jgi:hypothetical protein